MSITCQQRDLYGSLVCKSIKLLLPTSEVKPVLTYTYIHHMTQYNITYHITKCE